ncbi:MAG TPA: right-handed parallel beta-helix repeat-containing protein [Planctomycetota bacterium]|nr:right-handed parallel beta-helix repeat-containing protein [Planctomycetota bacterium]
MKEKAAIHLQSAVCFWFALIAAVHFADATDYHVAAATGNDANAGTEQQPFRTIQRAADVMAAGDTCIVHEGIYRETVTPARSGKTGARITFRAAPGEQATVSGADPVTGWVQHDGNIYKAPMGWDLGAGANQAFVDGQMVMEARWPNSTCLSRPTCLEIEGGSKWTSTTTGIINQALLAQPAGFWNGAIVYIRPYKKWYARTAQVVASSPGSLTIQLHSKNPLSYENIANGGDFFLTGTMGALDQPGEWVREGGMLHLWSPNSDNPEEHLVEAKRRLYAFDLSGRSHVTVESFKITAAAINSNSGTKNCLIDSVDASYVWHFTIIHEAPFNQGNRDLTGFTLCGSNNELRNSTIAWSAGNGVSLQGTGNRIYNCLIHDVGYAGTDAATINTARQATSGHEIAYNTLHSSARSTLIFYRAQNIKILHNLIHDAGLQFTDLGLAYTADTDGKGTEIGYNIFHSCPSSGIYLDNRTRNYIIHHNVVWNVRWSIHLNRPSNNNLVYHNTVGPPRSNGSSIAGYPTKDTEQYSASMEGTIIRNNIFRGPLVLGWGYVKDHNIESGTDPEFVDLAANDFRLQQTSPAIDAGVPTPYSGEINGNAPDCGAYEFGARQCPAGRADRADRENNARRAGPLSLRETTFQPVAPPPGRPPSKNRADGQAAP